MQIRASSQERYAKAASLEYGIDNKARRIAERGGLLERAGLTKRRLVARATAMRIRMRAFRYLRDPLEEMRPEIESELAAALAEAAEGGEGGA